MPVLPLAKKRQVVCVFAALLVPAACVPVRYVERPSVIGNNHSWILGTGSLYGGDVESWALVQGGFATKDREISIDIMPAAGSKHDRVLSIQAQIWSRLGTNYSYEYKETYVRIADGDWLRAKVPDSRNASMEYRPSMRDFYRRLPEYTGLGKLEKIGVNSVGLSLGMTLFLDIDPPPPGVPFVIRFAGLRRNGEAVHVPDVEFRFRRD